MADLPTGTDPFSHPGNLPASLTTLIGRAKEWLPHAVSS
jgi:hypothetical protein